MPEQIIIGFGWAIIATFFSALAIFAAVVFALAWMSAKEWCETRWWNE